MLAAARFDDPQRYVKHQTGHRPVSTNAAQLNEDKVLDQNRTDFFRHGAA